MAEKRGQYQYHDDGTTSQLVSGDISIKESTAIVPVDIQARLASTIQTHNAVSVAANTTSIPTTWMDCDGFDKLGITVLNDAGTPSSSGVYWSNDGVNIHGVESTTAASVFQQAFIFDIKARYAKVRVNNGDATLAHVMSAWAYLKS
jgi:hypothetical protein